MSKRLWVNITIALVFICLSVTGILLFLLPYNSLFSGIHVWFGICFLVATAFHLSVNFRPLVRYLKNRLSLVVMATAVCVLCVIGISVNYRIMPISSLLDFSSNMRKTAIITEMHPQTILIDRRTSAVSITIEVSAGEQYRGRSQPFSFGKTISSPAQSVFWLENIEGDYLETLFVTAKTGYPILYPKDRIRSEIIYRKEALPYWMHKRNVAVDGTTGATPHAHFNINFSPPNSLKKFRVLAEVNRSFDFNEYYTKEKYPDDPIYSGDGYPGQPSVIYAVDVDLSSDEKTYVMKPIGRGHHSGADGELYADMTGIDSALNIFRRLLVEVH